MWEKLYQKYNFKTNKPCVNSPLKDFLLPPLYYLLYYFLLLIFFCEFLNLCQFIVFLHFGAAPTPRKELNNSIGCNRLQAKICYKLQVAITGFRLLLQASGCYYSLQATGYRLQDTGYRLQGITVYRLQDTGYRLQATAYKLQATG